ncbi:MAG: 23S rRNA (guanosine(2251)-2'-O)-methyltransferase RlmB [Gammaproteobacteria bacterium]|nr:23S rRNA (guanosine(2251)-2'-O)-methyltransferase RlmB [Gammaproteobacteria bacterium]
MSAAQIIHGLHAVQALLTRHAGRVLKVQLARGREDERAATVIAAATAARIPLERVETQLLDKLTGGAVHQGVIAEVRPLAPWTEDALIAAIGTAIGAAGDSAVDSAAYAPLVLALDGVQDPHNLGACLRTADACGALAVVVPKDRAAQLNATVRKVAAGAAETTPVVAVTNLARCLRDLKGLGLWVVGADAAGPKLAAEVDLTGPAVLVMGAEGAGLRHNTRQHCDFLVRLPSLGAVASLNVSVAAGMLLYEATRQRGERRANATGLPA